MTTTAPRPAYSMTGYATAQSATEDGLAFTLTLKSVNHRFLDLNLRLPGDCDSVELLLRRLVKENAKRGHIDVTLHLERRTKEQSGAVQVNHELLASLVKAFQEAAKAHHFNVEPDLHDLLKLPGVLSTETPPSPEVSRAAGLEPAIALLAPSLLEQFNQVRAVEGAALVAELKGSMARLRGLSEECAQIRAGARQVYYERLRSRLTDLLGNIEETGKGVEGQGAQLPDQRLLAEAALLVDRSDIEEELVRLRAHIASFAEMLDAGGELGKRLDFLLQELNREANTLLSKTSTGDPTLGLRLTALGLEMKTEIERAREQVQNLE